MSSYNHFRSDYFQIDFTRAVWYIITMNIILGSASPRRADILSMLGIEYTVDAPETEIALPETIEPGSAEFIVRDIALDKAKQVQARHAGDLVIAADTLVVCDGRLLGKPADETQAKEMLKLLSGRRHSVYTGVAIVRNSNVVVSSELALVYFKKLNNRDITRYIATKEPFGKAGAYAAQGIGAAFIEAIQGDFFNVMGLPVRLLAAMLKDFGVLIP